MGEILPTMHHNLKLWKGLSDRVKIKTCPEAGADPAAGKGGAQIVDQWQGFQGAGPLAGVQMYIVYLDPRQGPLA